MLPRQPLHLGLEAVQRQRRTAQPNQAVELPEEWYMAHLVPLARCYLLERVASVEALLRAPAY